MTVPLQTPFSTYTGNGVTTNFAYTFKLATSADLRVLVEGVLQTTGYNVTNAGNDSGGSIVFTVAPAAGARIVFARDVVLQRLTDYQYAGDFLSPTVNLDFDRLWMALQDQSRLFARTLKIPVDEATNTVLPSVAERANRALGFDANGNVVAVPTTSAAVLANQLADQSTLSNGAKLVGTVGRTLADKLLDFRTVKDKGAKLDGTNNDFSAMAASAVAGTVYIPAGNYASAEVPVGSYQTSWVYEGYKQIPVYLEGAGEPAQFARRTQFDRMPGPHINVMNQASALIARPVGSGINGPTSADYGFTISMIKEGWPTSTQAGEIDGMNIVVRNSSSSVGGYNGDCAGILGNVGVTGNGYAAMLESQTSVLSDNGTVLRQLAAQQAVVDPVAGNYIGYYVKPTVGDGTVAFFAAAGVGTSWEYLFRGDTTQGGPGREAFYVTGNGEVQLFDIMGGGSKRTIRNNGSVFSILNNVGSVETLTLSDLGALSVSASMNVGSTFAVNNVQVVRNRETGYVAMTGTGNIGTAYDVNTVTLAQLAGRVKALQDSLSRHGLIGV